MAEDDKNLQETWESTTGGTVWVHLKDARAIGGWRVQKVGGKGTKRLKITVEEREFNQELIPFENAHHDPFTNGLLIRIHPKVVERGEYEYTNEQLIEMLAIDSEAVFEEQVKAIDSEVIVRRLLSLAEKHAPLVRYQAVQQLVDDRYRVGKTSRVVREMYADDDRYAAADL